MVYFARFYSQIRYSIIFWGSSSSMRNVFITQKKKSNQDYAETGSKIS